MVDCASSAGVEGLRVLEIGGGVGALQAELLKEGAASGEVVEMVPAYEEYAGEVARTTGVEERTSFRVADILEHPEDVEPADVVLLNRVVCCSPDGIELTAEAARHTRHTLVLSYPRDLLPIRVVIRLQNLAFYVVRRAFRVFVHPPAALVSAAESAGLRLSETASLGIWEVAVLQRSS